MKTWQPFPFYGNTANQKILNAAAELQDCKTPGLLLYDPDKGWAAIRCIDSKPESTDTPGIRVLAFLPPWYIVSVNAMLANPIAIRALIQNEITSLNRPPTV